MGFYFRKSVSVGPFRFNLSKSGVRVSAGIPGFRIGTGPRGNYVHMGAAGVYYRTTLPLGSARSRQQSAPAQPLAPTGYRRRAKIPAPSAAHHQQIESGAVTNMVSESAKDLLRQINEKHRRIRLGVVASVIGLAATIVLWWTEQSTAAAGALLVTGIAAAVGFYVDTMRRSVVLLYDFDATKRQSFEQVSQAFDAMSAAGRVWHVEAESRNINWKRNAGATLSQQRRTIQVRYGVPPVLRCNIDVPMIDAGKQQMYFFPDRLLVVDRLQVGAVEYADLTLDVRKVRFAEEDPVPNDAAIIGQTWKHPNKSGGPDRRFKDNREIPICAYEEAHFRSASGVNELIQFSREGLVHPFAASLRRLA